MTHRLAFLTCLAAISLASAARVNAAAIEHSPVGCVIADRFPRFEARITPADSVARARVFFRGEGGSGWYSVQMTRAGDSFTAFLPKPKKSLPRFSYYVEVADTALATSRTAEHTAKVGADAGTCTPDMMTAPGTATAAAAVLVEGPSGAAAIPAGFSGTSVVAAAPAAVAGVAAGAAGVTAASGGGIGAGTVVLAGAGVAAVGAGAVVATNVASEGEDGEDSGDGGNDLPQYSVEFGVGLSGIEVSVCAGRPLFWSSQAIVTLEGPFDVVWAPNEPNIARVVGNVSSTAFQATLTCVSGSPSGTLSATGSGGNYQGQWSFAGRQGNLQVIRR